jgi:hypothetical protein
MVLLVGLVGWAMATAKLWADYKHDRGMVEAKFKELERLRSQDNANQDWIQGVQADTVKLKSKVKAAWVDVYADQRDKVLKWPSVLGDEFLRIVPQLTATEEIPVDQRERYWNYAREEFPRLLKIVDARNYSDHAAAAAPDRGRMPGGRGPMADRARPVEKDDAEPERDYKVIWDAHDQEAVDKRLEWTQTPTTQEVRQTQEDLWVYQSLLTIIAHLNDRADGHHNAKVKELRSLLIGKEAALQFQAGMAEGRIEHPDIASAPGAATAGIAAGPGAMMPKPPQPGMPMPGGPMPGGAMPRGPGMPGGHDASALDEGRYVDEKGAPLAAGAAAAPEFRRMPIFMHLFMDQREVSRLLVECANSPLPVEVRQLRITPSQADAAGGARPAAPRGGAMRPGLRIGPGMGRPRAPVQNVKNDDDQRDKSPYDVMVELHGIIYIFNPPDLAKLSTAVALGGPPVDDAVPAEVAPAADVAPVAAPAGAVQPGAVQPGAVQPGAVQPGAVEADTDGAPAGPGAAAEPGEPATEESDEAMTPDGG